MSHRGGGNGVGSSEVAVPTPASSMGSGGVASLPDVALMSSSHTLAGRIAGGATAREVAWGGPGWRSVGTYDPTRFLATVAVWEPRALRTYVYPWLLVVSWAVVVSLAVQLGLEKGEHASLAAATEPYFTAYSLLLTVIGFLLVFRLNRAALRFWDSRTGWGKLVEAGRLVTELLCVHCTHDKKLRDDAVCWTLAFVVGCKQLLHGNRMDENELVGVLSVEQVEAMNAAGKHMPLFASSAIRTALTLAFGPSSARDGEELSTSLAVHRSSVRSSLEKQVNTLVSLIGMMERIKSTPLPLVYVTHLRTSLLMYLLFMPVLFAPTWGWGTPPAMAALSFFLLGVEGAATECETPFRKDHWNHLRMASACALLFDNVQQILEAAEWHEQRGAQLGQERAPPLSIVTSTP